VSWVRDVADSGDVDLVSLCRMSDGGFVAAGDGRLGTGPDGGKALGVPS